ncbi:MAG TPA: hypothetical protein ENO10_06815, partial [Salinimicrobium catena]|nr:hypothetical protein [Salinimicrobium catena]
MSRVPRIFLTIVSHCLPIRVVTPFLLFILLFSPGSFSLQGQILPDYNWLRKVDLPTVSGSSLNTEDITIAIAHDRAGNIYTLTVGSGVDKRDPEGNLLQKAFIPGSRMDSPRDLVVDDEGLIYVADYLAAGDDFRDNGKIRVFDGTGNYLPEKTFFTSFYRPLGLDLSGDKVYVAEYYDGLQGPEIGSTFSRVRIYDKNSGSLLKESKQVDIPLRIAVNSTGRVYVSQAGAANPAVLIFDENLNPSGQLPNITSPGSVLLDDLDFIHIIEYGNRIKFSEFINFDNLG